MAVNIFALLHVVESSCYADVCDQGGACKGAAAAESTQGWTGCSGRGSTGGSAGGSRAVHGHHRHPAGAKSVGGRQARTVARWALRLCSPCCPSPPVFAHPPFAQFTFLVSLHKTAGLWPLPMLLLALSLNCRPAHSRPMPILLCTSPRTTSRASCKLHGHLHRTAAHSDPLPILLCTSPRTTTRASCLSVASRASFTTVMPSAWRHPSSTRSASSNL